MKILLATHGHMASGMESTIEVLFNEVPENLEIFDAYVNDDNLDDKIIKFLNNTDQREIKILLSDLYGGSVCQQMSKYMSYENTYVVTGANLGLLMTLLTTDEELTKEELKNIIEDTKKFICIVDENEVDKSVLEDEIF